MKQITDKLNAIAKAIDENVDLPTTDLITDSLDAITKAYGGTPNDSNLIVDKLETIAGVAHGGGGGGGSGELNIIKDGTYNVSNYSSVNVDVIPFAYSISVVNNTMKTMYIEYAPFQMGGGPSSQSYLSITHYQLHQGSAETFNVLSAKSYTSGINYPYFIVCVRVDNLGENNLVLNSNALTIENTLVGENGYYAYLLQNDPAVASNKKLTFTLESIIDS